MQVTELNRAAFDNALSYAWQIINDLDAFAECENQELFFEQYCTKNNVQFNKNGTPE